MKQQITLDELKQYINIKNIISQYINVNNKNMALCPFHNDKNPSLAIYPSTNTFYCFGCNKAGDAFTFVMNYEHITFPEAINKIADYYNVEIKNESDNPIRVTIKKIANINNIINEKFKNNLKNDLIATNFLLKRNIPQSIIDEFDIGVSNGLYDYNHLLKKKNLTEKELLESGCFVRKKDKITQHFSNTRIIIPIKNSSGEIVGFSGRTIKDKDKIKYINNKESIAFKKRKILFNLDKAKKYISEKKQVIVVEGYFDVFRLYENDIKNVVAVMGSKLTDEHIHIISRIANEVIEVILAFDGDEAGEKALDNSIEPILKHKLNCKIITFDNDDPDMFILKYGIDEFNNKLNKLYIDGFEYKINKVMNKYDINTIYGKEMAVKDCFYFAKRINNNIITSSIIDILSFNLKIDKSELNNYFNGLIKELELNTNTINTMPKNDEMFFSIYEKRFIEALINICNIDMYKDTIKKMSFEKLLKNETNIKIANYIKTNTEKNVVINIEDIMSVLDEEEKNIIKSFSYETDGNDFYKLITYGKILYIHNLENMKEFYTKQVIDASKKSKFEEIYEYDLKRKEILQTISMVKTMSIEELVY